MRQVIADNSQLLKDDNWVQLRVMKAPKKKINGYTFSHEIRCNGNIVCFLPYKRENKSSNVEFLFRNEAVPCWELDKPILCCFTGGCDADLTPEETFLKELKEEAGYVVDAAEMFRVKNLGTSWATKSTDTVYHLFAVDVTNFPKEKMQDLFVETDLEKSSTNVWLEEPEIVTRVNEPFAYEIVAWVNAKCLT